MGVTLDLCFYRDPDLEEEDEEEEEAASEKAVCNQRGTQGGWTAPAPEIFLLLSQK